jgi:hypothetical protein
VFSGGRVVPSRTATTTGLTKNEGDPQSSGEVCDRGEVPYSLGGYLAEVNPDRPISAAQLLQAWGSERRPRGRANHLLPLSVPPPTESFSRFRHLREV